MSQTFTDALQNLIDALGKMPGMGPESVRRITFWVLQINPENIKDLAATFQAARDMIRSCKTCKNIAENPIYQICVDPRRDRSPIYVVEEIEDIASLEKTRSYRGLYHVLGGAIDPVNGIGPGQLRIRSLMEHLQDAEVKEVVIATNPNVEGETTATYLSWLLAALQIPASRLTNELPVDSDLEYADEVTLSHAPEGRHSLEQSRNYCFLLKTR